MELPGKCFGLALAARTDDASQTREESKFDDAMALQEELLQVKFLLPDDTTLTHEFKKGHTVMMLKGFLDTELELPPHSTQLYLDGNLMLDPLSLTDFATAVAARAIAVEVRQLEDRGGHRRK